MDDALLPKIAPAPGEEPGLSVLPLRDTEQTLEGMVQALPVSDIVFGGSVLLLVIMFHAFWIRLITTQFLKRSHSDRPRASLWRADLLFAQSIVALVALHLAEIILWTSALVFSGIVSDWSRAAYFAANCFTALGQPFALPPAWRIVAPIIAMSGIFTFAWTASVLVNFVSRYNQLRADVIGRGRPP
jgi:hypothetical protein